MRVFVDGRWFSQPGQGVATYLIGLHEHVLAARRQGRHRDIELVMGVQSASCMPASLQGEVETIELGDRSFAWRLLSQSTLLKRHGIDIAHFQYTAPLAKLGIRQLVTIHDVLFMRLRGHFSLQHRIPRATFYGLAAHRADALITVSEQSSDDIQRYLHTNRPIDIIYNGVETSLRSELPEPVPGLEPSRFILSVGRVEPRKNYRRLAAAFQQSQAKRAGKKLVIVGFCSEEFREEGAALSANPDLLWLNGATDGQLNWLLQNARAFVFPSLGEGFGIPVLEALTAGLPCAVSSTYPLADVKAICTVFDPRDIADLQGAIDIAVEAPRPGSIRQLLDRYSWSAMADRYADILRRVSHQPIR